MWGQGGNEIAWGTQWIADHFTSQTRAGKPVILEEFGVTINQSATYTAWLNEVLSSGLSGDLIWQVILYIKKYQTFGFNDVHHSGKLVLISQGMSLFFSFIIAKIFYDINVFAAAIPRMTDIPSTLTHLYILS